MYSLLLGNEFSLFPFTNYDHFLSLFMNLGSLPLISARCLYICTPHDTFFLFLSYVVFPVDIGHCGIYSAVRRITSKVCFRRHLEIQKETSLSGRTKSGVTTSEAKSRGGMYDLHIVFFRLHSSWASQIHMEAVSKCDGSIVITELFCTYRLFYTTSSLV